FRSGLTDATTNYQRSGVVWDFGVGAGGRIAPQDRVTIAHDANVASATDALWARAIPINGTPTPTFGVRKLVGNLDLVVLSGRAPTHPDEIAIAPTTMRALGLHVGSTARAGAAPGRVVHVVGKALLPGSSHTEYDESAWMTLGGMKPLIPADANEDFTE